MTLRYIGAKAITAGFRAQTRRHYGGVNERSWRNHGPGTMMVAATTYVAGEFRVHFLASSGQEACEAIDMETAFPAAEWEDLVG